MNKIPSPAAPLMRSKVSTFVDDFMAQVEQRNPDEPEFLQAVREVVSSLG